MDSSTYFLIFFAIFSSQFQVVAAWQLAVGASLGFVAFIGLAYFLRYYVYDKKCANSQVQHVESKPKERKVKMNTGQPAPQWQVGQQPYQGERPPQQPMHMAQGPMPPPMGDPAYPPPMPAGGYGPPPDSNPFKSAAYGQ